jgi:hypothetical protein
VGSPGIQARVNACARPHTGGAIGHPAYGIPQLCDDLDRFIFLLGGSDGEHILADGPAPNQPKEDPATTDRPAQHKPTDIASRQVDRFRQ